jgi:hypothetical protein
MRLDSDKSQSHKEKTRIGAGFLVAGEGFEPSTSGL